MARARVVFPLPRAPMDWEEALRLHDREGWSYARIALELKYSPMTVQTTLKRIGGRRRPRARWNEREKGRRLYGVWIQMRQRCRNPDHPSHRHYGARGISICGEWDDFEAFERWARSSGYRVGDSLALWNDGKGFSPANCHWLSPKEMQERRVRLFPPRHTRQVTAFGETKSLKAWARDPLCRVSRDTLTSRLDRGMTPERALTEEAGSEAALPTSADRDRKRGRRRRRSSRARIERLHTVEGLSCSQIARRLGLSYSGVCEALRTRNVYRSTRPPARRDPEDRRLYRTWLTMRLSCTNPRSKNWRYVGAKGIRYVHAWEQFEPFRDWARRSGALPGLCLVRIDRTRDYGPHNCAWVTRREASLRAHHRGGEKRQRVMITAFGETKGLSSWSRDKSCNVSLTGLLRRLRDGWEPEYAITAPPKSGGHGPSRGLRAFGETKSYSEWIRDPRCKLLSGDALRARLDRGMSPEEAIRTAPYGEVRPRTRG
jgi:DNA-binding CsgD family transcriptional regulator